jgi:hypothetical protein
MAPPVPIAINHIATTKKPVLLFPLKQTRKAFYQQKLPLQPQSFTINKQKTLFPTTAIYSGP